MAPSTLDTSIFLNKTNLLLAQNQRLVASWLPPRPKGKDPAPSKFQSDIEREEQEIFNTPVPELFGIGAVPPKDGDVRREELSSNDKLRKQLLGKDYAKKMKKGIKGAGQSSSGLLQMGSKPAPRPQSTKRAADDESGDDGGRSSLGKSAKRKHLQPESGNTEKDEGDTMEVGAQHMKRASNYLDEVLAERTLKKQKKSKKKKKPHIQPVDNTI